VSRFLPLCPGKIQEQSLATLQSFSFCVLVVMNFELLDDVSMGGHDSLFILDGTSAGIMLYWLSDFLQFYL